MNANFILRKFDEACSKYGIIATNQSDIRLFISEEKFIPSSIIVNQLEMGRRNFASCTVLPIESEQLSVHLDVLDSARQALESGVGIGFDLTPCAPETLLCPGSEWRLGVEEFIRDIVKDYDSIHTTQFLRPPAIMTSLRYDHPDIFRFVHFKINNSAPLVNISVAIDKSFKVALGRKGLVPFVYNKGRLRKNLRSTDIPKLNQIYQDKKVAKCDLYIDDSDVVFSKALDRSVGVVISGIVFLNCSALLDAIAGAAYHCGEPGIIDLEKLNKPLGHLNQEFFEGFRNRLLSTAPCGEQGLHPFELCHLGSINLPSFVEGRNFNVDNLRRASSAGCAFLNALIDMGDRLKGDFRNATLAYRRIGIGVMGLADTLCTMGIRYGSSRSIELSQLIAKTIQQGASDVSSSYSPVLKHHVSFNANHRLVKRDINPNASLVCFPPTGRISKIANCNPSIEPFFPFAPSRATERRDMRYSQTLDNALRKQGLTLQHWISLTEQSPSGKKYDGMLSKLDPDINHRKLVHKLSRIQTLFPTFFEVKPVLQIELAAAMQSQIDGGISKTINLPHGTSVHEMRSLFQKSMDSSLKGITLFRCTSIE